MTTDDRSRAPSPADPGSSADLGGAPKPSTGPIRERRPKRAGPSSHPKAGRAVPGPISSTPTHTQNPISDLMGPLDNPVDNPTLPPLLSDDEIGEWLGSSGEKLPNDREERFCHEYLIDYAVGKAFVRAGYPKGSVGMAPTMLRRPHIVLRIKELQDKMMRNLAITQERVAQEIAAIGFSRLSDVIEITPGGKLKVKDFCDMRDDQMASIDEIKFDPETGEVVSVKLHPKLPALEMLGKHLRMWDKDDNKKRGTTFNLNVKIGGDGHPQSPIIEGTVEGDDDES